MFQTKVFDRYLELLALRVKCLQQLHVELAEEVARQYTPSNIHELQYIIGGCNKPLCNYTKQDFLELQTKYFFYHALITGKLLSTYTDYEKKKLAQEVRAQFIQLFCEEDIQARICIGAMPS